MKDILNFEDDYLDNKKNDCYPMLARYDKLVELNVQKNAYKEMELKTINKGHFTGMEAVTEFRNHIKSAILSKHK